MDHLTNPTASEVSDKRHAIDLTALRQELWRMPTELIGNPTYSDSLESGPNDDLRLDFNRNYGGRWIDQTYEVRRN